MNQLAKATKIMSAVTPTAGAAGTSAINGTTLDCSGYDGVLIGVHFGTIVAGAVTSIKAQHGDASDMSDAADISGSSVTINDTDDDKVFYIDVRVKKRYLRVVVSRATQNATVAAVYVLYDAHNVPSAQDSAVSGVSVAA